MCCTLVAGLAVVQVVVIAYEVVNVRATLHVAVDSLVIAIPRTPPGAVLLTGGGTPGTESVVLDLDLQLNQG